MTISRQKTSQMRGLSILLIFFHNFIHRIYSIQECEFVYDPDQVNGVLSLSPLTTWDAFAVFFSFWGWYGVMTFIFLSGYGLVMKYEKKERTLHFWPYFKRNYIKLILLMLIPWVICFQTIFTRRALLQITYTINFIIPQKIYPGVFWYFGLTLQLYMVYVFFYRYRNRQWLWGVFVVMIVISFIFAMLPPNHLHYVLRHNFLFWLPVFLLGVWFARGGNNSKFMRVIEDNRLAAIVLFFVLWALSSVIRVLWVFSPIFFILLIIAAFHDRPDGTNTSGWKTYISKGLAYLGIISPGIFVCHPVFRTYAVDAYKEGHHIALIIGLYCVAVIVAAAVYTPLYKKILNKVLKWVKLDKE